MAWAAPGHCAPIDMPAQPLANALQALSRQSGVNILFQPDTVRTLRAPAVRHAASVEQALHALLSAGPLEAVRDPGGGFIVRRRQQPAPRPPRPAPIERHVVRAPADDPPPQVEPPAPRPEIVVNADRYGDAARQVTSIAITRVMTEDLVKAGTFNLATLPGVVASIQVAPVRTTALTFIRGVGTTISSPNADPTIAVDVNGVYIPMEMTNAVLFDIDHVDTLPGPQTTQFGRDATGGAIDIVTRRPGDRAGAQGLIELGNYGRVQIQNSLDIPISDRLALRSTVSWIRHNGYDSNGGDDQNSQALRETAVWKPDTRTMVTAIVSYSHEGGIGPFNFNVPAIYGPYRTLDFDPHGFFIDYRTFTGSTQVDRALGSWGSLTWIGAYNHLAQRTRTAAWSSTPLAVLNAAQSNDTTSQELRLSTHAGRLQGRIEAYWFDAASTYRSQTDNEETPVSTANAIGPFHAANRGWALFGRQSYAIVPWLRAVGGFRYGHTVKTIAGADSTTITTAGMSSTTTYPFAGALAQDHVDGRLGAEADLFSHTMLYGHVATGVTPGGFSASPATSGQPAAMPYRPADLTAWTLGMKNRLFDNRLTLNVEAFAYNYRNYQVSLRDLASYLNTVYNAARAQVHGVQIDGHANPTTHDDVRFDLTLQRARALALTTPLGTFDGYQLPYAPDAAMHGSWRHMFAMPHDGRLDTTLSAEHTASRWGTYPHWPGTFVHPTTTLDVNATWHLPGGHYTIAAWVRNLTDAVVPTQVTAAPSPAGPAQMFLAPPRTYGLRFGFDF
jgi:iron complex outermembrane recepter protein